MNKSGIVRRMDELGRIVIPKEIRRTMRLHEGDEMEIISEGEQLILRKYSLLENLSHSAAAAAKMLGEYVSGEILVTTAGEVVEAAGKHKKEFVGKKLAYSLVDMIMSRREQSFATNGIYRAVEDVESECAHVTVVPVVVAGDLVGAVVVLFNQSEAEGSLSFIRFAAEMLAAVLAE